MIGMMQGRLTQPNGRGIQFFPFENWENEFFLAKEIGFAEIEFIFDYCDYEENPLFTDVGTDKIVEIIRKSGVVVNSVCFDYFMRRAFFKSNDNEHIIKKEENTRVIKKVLEAMKKIGATLIEIPCVDDASLKNEREKTLFRQWLLSIIDDVKFEKIKFALETDLPPKMFKEYIDSFKRKNLGANYDSGNSSGIGYDPYEEITTLGDRIFNIHIKDRIYHGTTVALGTGSADFQGVIKGLKTIKYSNKFILQAARGIEGDEKNNLIEQKKFVIDLLGGCNGKEYSNYSS